MGTKFLSEAQVKIKFTLDDTSADLMNQTPRVEPKPLDYPTAYLTKPSWSTETIAFKYGESKVWKENISFEFNGMPVNGFITVRDKASQTSNPGLALFRYNRLIQGSSTKEYRPKFLLGSQNKAAPSKIYMELHLDGQEISHTKGKFNFDEMRLLQILKAHPTVKNYIDQAEAHRPTYEEENKVIACTSKDEVASTLLEMKNEKIKSSKNKNTKSKAPYKSGNSGQNNTKSSNPKNTQPVDILHTIKTPNSIIIEDIAKEAIDLYLTDKMWSFALCYRVVLEKIVHEKLKVSHPDIYTNNFSEKGIAAILKYLHSNQNLVSGSRWKALRRSLNTLSNDELIDITNLASHGHSKPTKDRLDTLLINTQELVKWTMDTGND